VSICTCTTDQACEVHARANGIKELSGELSFGRTVRLSRKLPITEWCDGERGTMWADLRIKDLESQQAEQIKELEGLRDEKFPFDRDTVISRLEAQLKRSAGVIEELEDENAHQLRYMQFMEETLNETGALAKVFASFDTPKKED
jgi:uncharacterized coiled-coil protein SlyX